jgi:hypothetical protein
LSHLGGRARPGLAEPDDAAPPIRVAQRTEKAAAAGKPFDAGKEAINHFADSLPTGKHWPSGVAYSAEDIEALKKFGSRVGGVGSALELGVGLYEVFGEGKSPLEVGAKTVGGVAGAWGLGQVGALGGGAIAGPPGVFAGALFFGTLGAFSGEKAAERALEWLKK